MVHSGSNGFTLACLDAAWVIVCSFLGAKWSPGSFGFAWVDSGAPRCRRVFSCSRGLTRKRLGVAGSILVREGSRGST